MIDINNLTTTETDEELNLISDLEDYLKEVSNKEKDKIFGGAVFGWFGFIKI